MSTGLETWIELERGANARDVGGLEFDGGKVRRGVLLRSASIAQLTAADVRRLVDERGVRRVVDLRTTREVVASGPGPFTGEQDVVTYELPLSRQLSGPGAELDPDDGEAVWRREAKLAAGPLAGAYLGYLIQDADRILAALRAIAEPDGATLVHCAAGKDRTGTVIALALSAAGVPADAVAREYAASSPHLAAIIAHLAREPQYAGQMAGMPEIHDPTAPVMRTVLAAIAERFGGVEGWLGIHGWTVADTTQLRERLIAPA